MAEIQIHLFGKLRIYDGNKYPLRLEASKAQELLCYLLLNRHRAHSRETLTATLCGDTAAAASKKSIRQALWQLQSMFNNFPQRLPLLVVDGEWIQVDTKADLWLDVALFEEAWALVQGVPGEHLDPHRATILKSALVLYEADLLETWYQEWCLFDRERLLALYLGILDKLMTYGEVHGEYEQAIEYGTLILRHDRAREHTHRQMMRIYFLAGDRTTALRQYRRCVAALHEELGVSVARSTENLYLQIEGDHVDGVSPALKAQNRSFDEPQSSVAALQSRLEHYRAALFQVQRNVEDDLRALEVTLRSLHPSIDQ